MAHEATLAVNPLNSENLIAASRKFIDAEMQRGTVSVLYSKDSGTSWFTATLPPVAGAVDYMRNPVLAFGPDGTAYLFVLLASSPQVFVSVTGGATWRTSERDSFQRVAFPWFACAPARPGRLYVAAGTVIEPWEFMFSDDSGKSWMNSQALKIGDAEAVLISPHVSVARNGTVHVIGLGVAEGLAILHWRSVNGGRDFTWQRVALSPSMDRPPLNVGLFHDSGIRRVTGCAMTDLLSRDGRERRGLGRPRGRYFIPAD